MELKAVFSIDGQKEIVRAEGRIGGYPKINVVVGRSGDGRRGMCTGFYSG